MDAQPALFRVQPNPLLRAHVWNFLNPVDERPVNILHLGAEGADVYVGVTLRAEEMTVLRQPPPGLDTALLPRATAFRQSSARSCGLRSAVDWYPATCAFGRAR